MISLKVSNRQLSSFLLTLLFVGTAKAATVRLEERDFDVNYFAVLELPINMMELMSGNFDNLPSPQQVQQAYQNKISGLQLVDHKQPISIAEASNLARAKAILTDTNTRFEYLKNVAMKYRTKTEIVHPRDATLPPGIDPKSLVGVVVVDGVVVAGIQMGFNVSHAKYPVSYLREHPEENWAIKYMKDSIDGPKPIDLMRYVDFSSLAPKWNKWTYSAEGLRQVRQEFERILKIAPEMRPTSKAGFREALAFLYWWFAQPESHQHKDLAIEMIQRFEAAQLRGSLQSYHIMMASVSQPSWRNRSWITELLGHDRAFFALGEIAGTPEVIAHADLVDAILQLPEADDFGHQTFESLFQNPESANHPEWARRFLDQQHDAKNEKAFLNLFLKVLTQQPHWRQRHPEIITEALLRICKINSGSRKDYVFELLTKPEATAHPEWLEILVKTDVGDALTLDLNQVLATDLWYNNPYLRKILRGEPPTVETLRAARWLKVVESPELVATSLRSSIGSRGANMCSNVLRN